MANKKRGIRIFNNKRGLEHELFFTVFEIILVAVIVFALLSFVNDVAKQTIFEKNYLARDLALLINTIYASPGEITYSYKENTNDFTFNFHDNKVEVYKDEESEQKIFYLFAQNKKIPFGGKTLRPKQKGTEIDFYKSEQSLAVGKKEDMQKSSSLPPEALTNIP